MDNDARRAFEELIEFLRGYSLRNVVDDDAFLLRTKSIYRRHHAILVWYASLETGVLWAGAPKKDELFRLYLKECVSDLSQSFFLFCHGLYKPAHLVLRSGLENFIRLIGIHQDQSVLTLFSVYELIGLVKTAPLIQKSAAATKQFKKMTDAYGSLCNFVHTSDERHMVFMNFVGEFPTFEETRASEYQTLHRSITVGISSLLCLMFRTRYKRMHHRHFDLVSDVIPKDVKKEVMPDD
jgi:hypothetical protein